jgi:hypothetical protein
LRRNWIAIRAPSDGGGGPWIRRCAAPGGPAWPPICAATARINGGPATAARLVKEYTDFYVHAGSTPQLRREKFAGRGGSRQLQLALQERFQFSAKINPRINPDNQRAA